MIRRGSMAFDDDGKIKNIIERLVARGVHPLIAAGILSNYVGRLALGGIGGAKALEMFEEDFLTR
jgi:hypothetical protein